ncbi:MAG: phosphomethylpyrimidine synthase ThiC, partial [Candidatus Caldipriscus sp.]
MNLTQLEAAKRGIVTPEMEYVAKVEGLDPRVVMEGVARGE